MAAALILIALLLETAVSFRNERRLRARGATEPAGDVWPVMAAAYPAAFVAMFVEGLLRGGPGHPVFAAGLAVWAAAKALKLWAIMSLGARWSFRVLVLPGAPLVAIGPYRRLRHPNYVAVAGELAGAGLMMAAPLSAVVAIPAFADILRRRIRVEERALGIHRT